MGKMEKYDLSKHCNIHYELIHGAQRFPQHAINLTIKTDNEIDSDAYIRHAF